MPDDTPTEPPIGLNAAAAAALIGISQSHFFSLLATGRIGPTAIRLGRAKRYLRPEILAWLSAGAPCRSKWETLKSEGRAAK